MSSTIWNTLTNVAKFSEVTTKRSHKGRIKDAAIDKFLLFKINSFIVIVILVIKVKLIYLMKVHQANWKQTNRLKLLNLIHLINGDAASTAAFFIFKVSSTHTCILLIYSIYIYTSRCHSELHTNEVNACIEPKTLKPKDERERERVIFLPCAPFSWFVISNAALDLQMCRKMLKEPGKHADRQTDRQADTVKHTPPLRWLEETN